ncbi:hypothetical protein FIBSPDRAFT_358941 [Athelia psychrophila]|uniref:Uncharacterized protein n=1 Tax=Athelia psychrophila TaxID=1759441 RepID=A0A166PLI5_9AGAM|nr:hypothetical protein FIBSPDRAFT_358941 [Fibularhizoctonia sp. CBS 109695]
MSACPALNTLANHAYLIHHYLRIHPTLSISICTSRFCLVSNSRSPRLQPSFHVSSLVLSGALFDFVLNSRSGKPRSCASSKRATPSPPSYGSSPLAPSFSS